jgi:membrane-associated phospholipid phosphatase
MTRPPPSHATSLWRVWNDKFVVESREMTAASKQRLFTTAIALVIVGGSLFTLTLISVILKDAFFELDAPVRAWALGDRSPNLTIVMIGLAIFFGPIALPAIVLVVTVVWGMVAKHAWRPMLLAAAMLAGVILSNVIGSAVGRSRPPVDSMLYGVDLTFSFPSGHVLGASDFALVLVYLVFSRRHNAVGATVAFVVAAVCIVAAAGSRVYLGYHWATDALASMSLSLMILGAVIALDTWRTARLPGEPSLEDVPAS